tara:strand:+ start:396 stop:2066 length:1671 start_codon:yes stop_codon:yes gene_type:complete
MAKKSALSIAMQYAHDVINEKVIVGRLVKLAVKRHFDDLKNGHKRGLYFDEKAGQHIIDFFKFIKHVKGPKAKEVLELEPFQQFRLWCLFGWKKENGIRRFNYAYNSIGRKNGKTTEAAGIALYLLIADGEKGAEIYTCATKKEQAKVAFDIASAQVQKNKHLQRHIGIHKNNLHVLSTHSKMTALSSDSSTLDGLNPSGVILDEFHAAKDQGKLFNVLKSGMGSRDNPMMYIITTAGFNKESACFKLRKTCIDILEGRKVDDTTFVLIFTLDDDDDWTDKKNWVKANPNNGKAIKLNYLTDEFNQAINTPSQQVNFKTKNLNIWTDSSINWIPDEAWKKCNKGGEIETLKKRACYGGLDLASTSDFNAFVLLFPDVDNESFDVVCHFWAPKEKANSKKDQIDYLQWEKQNYIKLTEGNVVDHRIIQADILNICTQYNVKSIAFDRFLAYTGLVQELTEEGLPMQEFGQGFLSMSEPTKQLERLIHTKRINHFGNPILRWMASNVELKIDPAFNIKIDKAKSSEKVDGMVALVMALGASAAEDDESIYEGQEIRII